MVTEFPDLNVKVCLLQMTSPSPYHSLHHSGCGRNQNSRWDFNYHIRASLKLFAYGICDCI